jgi:hypothetical protein
MLCVRVRVRLWSSGRAGVEKIADARSWMTAEREWYFEERNFYKKDIDRYDGMWHYPYVRLHEHVKQLH